MKEAQNRTAAVQEANTTAKSKIIENGGACNVSMYANIQTDTPVPHLLSFVRQTSTCAFLLIALLEQLADPQLKQRQWFIASTTQDDEITAVAAVHRSDGYCLIHGIDDDDIQILLARLAAEHPILRLAGEAEIIDMILEDRAFGSRVTRKETEYFMRLRAFDQKVIPDGNYRAATPQDIPALRAYAAGYSAEHDVPFDCDWHRMVAERKAMVSDSRTPDAPDEVAACVMRGIMTRNMVLCSGVYTFPQFRGQGYATRLVANFCFEASLARLDTCLYVGIHNQPAYRAYRRVGFQKAGRYCTVNLSDTTPN